MKKQTGLIIVMGIEALALIFGFIGNIYGVAQTSNIQFVFNIIALIAASVYLVIGYLKEGQVFFKIFLWALVIKDFASIVTFGLEKETNALLFVTTVLSLLAVFALTVTKDFGKKNSFFCSGLYFGLHLLNLVYGIIQVSQRMAGTTEGTVYLIYQLTGFVVACILSIMVYAKYRDKAIRKAIGE